MIKATINELISFPSSITAFRPLNGVDVGDEDIESSIPFSLIGTGVGIVEPTAVSVGVFIDACVGLASLMIGLDVGFDNRLIGDSDG